MMSFTNVVGVGLAVAQTLLCWLGPGGSGLVSPALTHGSVSAPASALLVPPREATPPPIDTVHSGRAYGRDVEIGGHGSGQSSDPRPSRPSAGRGSGGSVAGPGAAAGERVCPPTLYTFGIYREVITECDGAAGTERAPWFERQDSSEVPPEGEPTVQVIQVTREDVQSLLVNSGSLEVQPDQSWVLVGTDTVVMTDAEEHLLGTRVLDLDIDVRVTPTLFTWNFGDGSVPLTGTDPGVPWPNHTVSHAYRAPGTVTISLRTEWDAHFRVEGTSAWIPVVGRAVTEAQSESIEVVTAKPRLTDG